MSVHIGLFKASPYTVFMEASSVKWKQVLAQLFLI